MDSRSWSEIRRLQRLTLPMFATGSGEAVGINLGCVKWGRLKLQKAVAFNAVDRS
jgi:hypothetical protein